MEAVLLAAAGDRARRIPPLSELQALGEIRLTLTGVLLNLWPMVTIIQRIVAESVALKSSFFDANGETIAALARVIGAAMQKNNKLLIFGNGGSAADAQHLAAEWVGRFQAERGPLPALALTTDSSILTAIGNDYGFEYVFDRQIRALGRAGDVAIGISTSGNSPNVLLAISAARELGIATAAFTGNNGGKLGAMADYHLNVPVKSTARVQEIHIMIGHILCELVDNQLMRS